MTPIFTPEVISLISTISVFTKTSVDYMQNHTLNWCVKHKFGHYHIELDIHNKLLKFIDYDGDDKTYFAITYKAIQAGFDADDYYETNSHEEEEVEEEIEKEMD